MFVNILFSFVEKERQADGIAPTQKQGETFRVSSSWNYKGIYNDWKSSVFAHSLEKGE